MTLNGAIARWQPDGHRYGLRFGAAAEPFRGLLLSGEVQRRPKAGKNRSAWPGGLTGGFGLSWSRIKIDYALSPFGALGNVQTFSLSGRF